MRGEAEEGKELGRITRNLRRSGDCSLVAENFSQGLILKTDTMILELIFSCLFFFFFFKSGACISHNRLHFKITLKGIQN